MASDVLCNRYQLELPRFPQQFRFSLKNPGEIFKTKGGRRASEAFRALAGSSLRTVWERERKSRYANRRVGKDFSL